MSKAFAAIAGFYNEEGFTPIVVPADIDEVYAKIDEMTRNYCAGYIIPEDEVAILRAYLPAIGADEAAPGDDGSMVGKGSIEREASGDGIELKATANIDITSVWQHDRKQWSGMMEVAKVGGDARAIELDFEFRFLSIGKNEAGQFQVLYSEDYKRIFHDEKTLTEFNAGEPFAASRFDISKYQQWGFLARVSCSVCTETGMTLI